MWLNIFKSRKKISRKKIHEGLGNPGIAMYVKREYYEDALKHLEQLNQFHDLNRTDGILELTCRDFEFKSEITHCDYSSELLADEDILILIWRVDKKFQKKK